MDWSIRLYVHIYTYVPKEKCNNDRSISSTAFPTKDSIYILCSSIYRTPVIIIFRLLIAIQATNYWKQKKDRNKRKNKDYEKINVIAHELILQISMASIVCMIEWSRSTEPASSTIDTTPQRYGDVVATRLCNTVSKYLFFFTEVNLPGNDSMPVQCALS